MDGLSFYGTFYGMEPLVYIFSQYGGTRVCQSCHKQKQHFKKCHDAISDRLLTELYLARVQIYENCYTLCVFSCSAFLAGKIYFVYRQPCLM